MDEGRNDEHLA